MPNKEDFYKDIAVLMKAHGITDVVLIHRRGGKIGTTAMCSTDGEWTKRFHKLSDDLTSYFGGDPSNAENAKRVF